MQNLFKDEAKPASQSHVMDVPPPPANEEFEGTYNDDTVNLVMSLMSLNVTDDEELKDLDASMKSIQLSESEESNESSMSSLDEDNLVSFSDSSYAVVDLLFIVLPIVCGGSVFVCVLLCITLCAFLFCYHLEEEQKLCCFAFTVLQMSCYCKCVVALLLGALGWSAVCDCGIF